MSAQLYKFRSLDGSSLDRTKAVIQDRRLFFSAPQNLNDPFDCLPVLSTEATEEQIFKWLRPFVIQRNPVLLPSEIDAEVRERMKSVPPLSSPEIISLNESVFEKSKIHLGVLSLSSSADNYVLWSHYADSHRGICLRFERTDASYFSEAKQVIYSNNRPTLNIFTQSMDEQVNAALMHKASHWSYEEEWRVFKSRRSGGPGLYEFPAQSLSAIILGARITEEMEREVRSWDAAVPILKAAIHPKEYRVEIGR